MARVRKDCPDCGGLQPVELTLSPLGTPENPSSKVKWTGVCKTCGHVYAPDTDEEVLRAKEWGDQIKAEHGSMLHDDGTLRKSTD